MQRIIHNVYLAVRRCRPLCYHLAFGRRWQHDGPRKLFDHASKHQHQPRPRRHNLLLLLSRPLFCHGLDLGERKIAGSIGSVVGVPPRVWAKAASVCCCCRRHCRRCRRCHCRCCSHNLKLRKAVRDQEMKALSNGIGRRDGSIVQYH